MEGLGVVQSDGNAAEVPQPQPEQPLQQLQPTPPPTLQLVSEMSAAALPVLASEHSLPQTAPLDDPADEDYEDDEGGERRLRSYNKRGPRRHYSDADEDEDGEFEAPRSVRYPKGGKKQYKRQSVEGRDSYGRTTRRHRMNREMPPLTLQHCSQILEVLEGDEGIAAFAEPVDVIEYPDYLKIVQTPMDLSRIRRSLDAVLKPSPVAEEPPAVAAPAAPSVMNVTASAAVVPLSMQAKPQAYSVVEFLRDVRLIWSNCMLYNRRGTPIYKAAKHYEQEFERLVAETQEQLAAELQAKGGAEGHAGGADGDAGAYGRSRSSERPRVTRSGRSSAALKSYVDDDEDLWDDSEEREILKSRERKKTSTVDDDGEPKLDKILASRLISDEEWQRKEEQEKKRKESLNAEGSDEDEAEEPVKAESAAAGEVKAEQEGGEGAVKAEGSGSAAAAHATPKKAKGSEGPAALGKREYLVKWEATSYLHVEWVPRSRISKYRQKLRRYENQLERNLAEGIEEPDEPFDPRYVEVQRVIGYFKDEDGEEWFMCKWEELPYSESTWELRKDINDDKVIEEYFKWSKVPPPPPTRPSAKDHSNLAEGLKYCNENELRSYQLEGLNWLIYNWYQRRGSILADEMGLGKTIQAVSFLHYLREKEGIPGPFMIACNLSTLEHWYREVREWTDLNVVMYYGTREDRAVIREHEFFFKNEKGHIIAPQMRKAHVILTTYDMVTAEDWEELRAIRWACIIVDEAQRMKGHTSKFRENMMSMVSDHRVLLTGTPIQNNTTELWALLNFIDPWEFADLGKFQGRFGTLTTSKQVNQLHEVLRPYLLRRMKEDVEKSIPPKEETIVEVELTSLQKQYYRAVLEANRSFLNRGCVGNNVPHLLNVAIQLRKVCNHPFLLRGVEDKEVGQLSEERYLDAFIQSSGKMVLLDKLLPKLRAGKHRVLIFSQMVKVLDLLETYLAHRGWKWERIDGSIRGNDRQMAIDRFCKPDSDIFVFLLCTRAGGVGINLTAADTVIIFDSDWNPQNDVQAQARCHRIGQKELVKVYRLITRNTYEREMFERSSKKLGLDQAVLHNMDLKAETVLDGKDMEELLKFGAYDLFREDADQDSRAREFCEADIDKILENQAVNVKYERKMTADGSTFSKAVFQASAADRSIDMHAANFWDLVLGAEHNSAYLLDQVQTGAATESDETIKAFFKDLEEVCNQARKAWESGRAGELPADLHILSKVLQIVVETPDFSLQQRQQAQNWYRTVITPSRRGREDGDFAQRRASAPIMSRNADTDNKWTRYERSRLQKLIINYAAPRWDDMRINADLAKRSSHEVKVFVLDFVRQCIRYAGDSETEQTFRALLEVLDPDLAMQPLIEEKEVDESLSEAVYVQFIKNKVAGWGRRINEVRKVHQYCQPADGSEFFVPPFRKLLTRWWGPEADKQLMLAVKEHGMEADAMARIIKDPHYMFRNHLAPGMLEEEANGDDEDGGGGSSRGKRSRSSSRSRGGGAGGSGSAAAAKTKRRTSATSLAAAATALSDAGEGADVAGANADGAGDKEEVFAVPAAKQGKRTLTVSVVFKNVERECETVIEEAKFGKDAMLWELYMPPTAVLQKRLGFIMKGIDTFGKEDEVRAERLRKKREAKAARDSKKVSNVWNAREVKEFRTVIFRYGPGLWDNIIVAAKLQKDAAMVEAQYKALEAQCLEVAAGAKDPQYSLFGDIAENETYFSEDDDGVSSANPHSKSKSDGANNNNNNNNNGSKSSSAAAASGSSTKRAKRDEKESKGKEKDEDDDEDDEDDEDFNDEPAPSSSQPGAGGGESVVALTAEYARKFLRRMGLLRDIREKILPHRRLAQRLMYATETDMPEWYDVGLYDYLLLRDVAQNGLGLPEWTQILKSEDCGYLRNQAEEALAWMQQAVNQEKPILCRLEYLRAIVLNPVAVQAMATRVGYQTYQPRNGEVLDL